MPLEAPVTTTVAWRRLSMTTPLPSPTLGGSTASYVQQYYPLEHGFKSSYCGAHHWYLSRVTMIGSCALRGQTVGPNSFHTWEIRIVLVRLAP